MQPARLPDKSRRSGVSLSFDGIIVALICSYARKLIAEYGNFWRRVAEWPLNRPIQPSQRLITEIADKKPAQLPVYLVYSGADVWKRILMRSSGATTVFAYRCYYLLLIESLHGEILTAHPARPPASPLFNIYSKLRSWAVTLSLKSLLCFAGGDFIANDIAARSSFQKQSPVRSCPAHCPSSGDETLARVDSLPSGISRETRGARR